MYWKYCNKMKLKQISEIHTGLVLSRKKALKLDNYEKYSLLNLKCINTDGTIDNTQFEEFKSSEVLDNQYLTQEGDIIMRLTSPYTAIFIDKPHQNLLISSNFAVIKIRDSKILPEYLTELLNSKIIRKQIDRSAMGTIMPMLKTSALKEISIKEISKEEQKIIVKYLDCYYKEKHLVEKLLEQRLKMKQQIMLKFMRG